MSGWFSCKRGITSHPLFKGHPERLAIWVWLLDNAAWKDTTQDVNGKTVIVPRGSVSASERRIADETGVGYQVVRTFIARLKTEHMVNARVTQGRNLISITNWDTYQRGGGSANAVGNAGLTQDQRTKETREQIPPSEKGSPASSVAPSSSPPSAQTARVSKPKPVRSDEFWNAYPRRNGKRAGKAEAMAEYARLVGLGIPEERLIVAAQAYADECSRTDTFACDAVRWLKKRRWEDETAEIIPLHAHPTQQRTKGNERLAAFLDAARNPREPGVAGGPGVYPPGVLLPRR